MPCIGHRHLAQAFDQAVAQIRLSRHAVEALADALLEHQVLPPGEVAVIVADSLKNNTTSCASTVTNMD